jgi:hypothetical protein
VLAGGADAVARALAEAGTERGRRPAGAGWAREADGVERGPAAGLGAFVSTNGADPMRTFPFLLEADGARLRALTAATGLVLPAGAEDPDSPVGKGRIVWWHERLVAALDTAGFCAFSAAGLLADGALDLDGLARCLGHADGRALLAHGHATVGLRRELARRWEGGPRELPAELANLWAELADYERCCEDPRAALAPPEARPGAGAPPADDDGAGGVDPAGAAPRREDAREGVALLRPSGPLARRLGAELAVALDRPRPLAAVLGELPPEARTALLRDGALLATAYRRGRRLAATDEVAPGDVVDLVVAIAGG